ncbi:MAG: DUF4097 domain-containing protein [bacterium]
MESKNAKVLRDWLIFAMVLALSACVINTFDEDVQNIDFTAEASFSEEQPVAQLKRLVLEGINGPVEINGRAGATAVKIWGERRVNSESQADAEAHLSELKVEITPTAEEFLVKTVQPQNNQGRSYVVNYHVTLPLDMEVAITNINGAVQIDSLSADVEVNNINGQVWLNDIFASVEVDLVNGQIFSKVFLPLNGQIELTTVNGQIDLRIPQTTSAELSARLSNGVIKLSNLNPQQVESSKTFFRDKLRDGQGRIDLRTVNGSIQISGF